MNINKLLYRSLILLHCSFTLLLFLVPHNSYSSEADTNYNVPKSITISYRQDSAPIQFKNDYGEADGILIDIWKLWRKKSGIQVKFIPGFNKESQLMVKSGQADVMAGLFKSPKRAKFLDFSQAITSTSYHLFYNKNITNIKSKNDLILYEVGVTAGSFHENYMRTNHPDIKLILFKGYSNLFKAAINGTIDTFITQPQYLSRYLNKLNLVDNFRMLITPLYTRAYKAAVAKGNKELQKTINLYLNELTPSEYVAISNKWLGLKLHQSKQTNTLSFTAKEKTWLKTNPIIEIGIDGAWPPIDFLDNEGNHVGIMADYLKIISDKLGIKFEPNISPSFKDMLSKVKQGKLAIGGPISKNKERLKLLNYSKHPVINVSHVIIGQTKEKQINNASQITNHKITIEDGFSLLPKIKETFPSSTIVIAKDTLDALQKVSWGQADFYIGNQAVAYWLARKNQLSNLQVVASPGFPIKPNNFAVAKHYDDGMLLGLVNKAMSSITEQQKHTIENRWIGSTAKQKENEEVHVAFSDMELEWIKQNPSITIGIGNGWPPFNYLDSEGKFTGLTKDYLTLLSRISGLEFKLLITDWKTVLSKFKAGNLDILSSALHTKEREQFGLYTKPHIKLRDFIYTRSNNEQIKSFQDLNGKTLVRVEKYATLAPYLKKLSGTKIIEVPTILDMISAVHNGDADAFLEGQASINYLLKENMISGLKSISQTVSKPATAHMLVKKELTILHSIFDKSLTAITRDQQTEIFNRWVNINTQDYQETLAITLSAKQKAWIKEHNTINVGGELDWAPYAYINKKGDYTGLANDYLKLVAKKTGLNFKINTKRKWKEILEATKDHQLDMIPALLENNDRKKYLSFSQPYLTVPEYIYTLTSTKTIKDLSSLNDKTVALPKNYQITKWIKQHYPKINIIEKDSILDCLNAVVIKEVNAYIGDNPSTNYIINNNYIPNIKINNIINERPKVKIKMGVRSDFPILLSIIQLVLESITEEERINIEHKWITLVEKKHKRIKLNRIEKNWIEKNPKLKLAVDNTWVPYQYRDKNSGELAGISSSYLKIIKEKTGLEIELVSTKNWSDAIKKIKNNEADMFSSIIKTADREKYLEFSTPYLHAPAVIITKNSETFITNIKALEGKRVAFVKDYAVSEIIPKAYPLIKPVYYNSTKEALKAVSEGDVYSLITLLESASQSINEHRFHNLKISGKTDYNLAISFAIRSELGLTGISIINKALNSIGEIEKIHIYNRWVALKFDKQVDYTLLFQISGIFILFIIITLFWNRKLSNAKDIIEHRTQQLNKQKIFLKTLMDSQEQLVLTIDGSTIINVNKRFKAFYHIKKLKEFTTKYDCICDTFDTNSPKDFLRINMGGISWINYIINNPELTHKAQITQNNKTTIFSVTAALLPTAGEHIKTSVFTDITQLENTQKEMAKLYEQVIDSIEYASLIQHALIPDNSLFSEFFNDSFTLWQPKDVVGGDIYFVEKINNDEILIFIIDCTGHGVPGAFVSMMVKAVERQILSEIRLDKIISPGKILTRFNQEIKHLLKQETKDSVSNAGFDGGIIYYNKKIKKLIFSGAHLSLFLVENKIITEIKGNRHSIGYKTSDKNYQFLDHEVNINTGNSIYITTDGYIDQNGGDKGFPFGKKRFKTLIENNQNLKFQDQKNIFIDEIKNYAGDHEVNDDMTMVAVKL